MSPKPSRAQRQAILDLLLDELRRARDAAVEAGASNAEVEDAADCRRANLDGIDRTIDD